MSEQPINRTNAKTLDQLVNERTECEVLLDKIDSSEVWQLITRDAEQNVRDIDARWHLSEGKNLDNLRAAKLAYAHILSYKHTIESKLAGIVKQIDIETNTDTNIAKDFDNEGTYDG